MISIKFYRRDGRIIREDEASDDVEAAKMIFTELRRNTDIDTATWKDTKGRRHSIGRTKFGGKGLVLR